MISPQTITINAVRTAMRLPGFDAAQAQLAMAPRPRTRLRQYEGVPPKEAGVLVLIFPAANGVLHSVLTRRTEHLRGHSGQISFPGGRRDPDDVSFTATALRETCEELGICEDRVDLLGHLASFYIPPSHYNVYPTVGVMQAEPVFEPNPYEVAQVIPLPLHVLLDPGIKRVDTREFNGMKIQIPYYDVDGHQVWGATAVMLSELEHRLRAALNGA
ncbi:MAG: NUDIX hydrolase [Chloroflexota bacterium]